MKKIMSIAILTSLAFPNILNATTPGIYFGGGFGYTKETNMHDYLKNFNVNRDLKNTLKHGGTGGKLFAGYNFNKYFGLEAGFASYQTSRYQATLIDVDAKVSFNYDYKFDLPNVVAKAYLPLNNNKFNVYGLLGIGYTLAKSTSTSQNIVESLTEVIVDFPEAFEKKRSHLYIPIAGLGATYSFDNHLATGVEYTITASSRGDSPASLPITNAQMASVNLIYQF